MGTDLRDTPDPVYKSRRPGVKDTDILPLVVPSFLLKSLHSSDVFIGRTEGVPSVLSDQGLVNDGVLYRPVPERLSTLLVRLVSRHPVRRRSWVHDL